MTVILTPEQEALVKKQMESGHFSSPLEVIDEALHLLDEQDELRRATQDGLAALERGESREYESGAALVADIKRTARERREVQAAA